MIQLQTWETKKILTFARFQTQFDLKNPPVRVSIPDQRYRS